MIPARVPNLVGHEERPAAGGAWRAVEAQHIASTRRLVDSNEEQAVLEELLEESKPRMPASTVGLHYLLATPFRYPPWHRGSRFRSPAEPGVFYAAEERRTACAELGYWRWRFVTDSSGLDESRRPSERTIQPGNRSNSSWRSPLFSPSTLVSATGPSVIR